MRRSNLFIKLIAVVVFIAVASYIGFYAFNAMQNVFVTMPAVSYTIEETSPARGFVVRSETVLPGGGEMIMPVVGEGVRVRAGGAVAVEYAGRQALETASEIYALRLQIAQLERLADGDAEAMSLASVVDLSRAVHGGQLGGLQELSLRIETYIFGSSHEGDLESLHTRLETLERRGYQMRTVYAPVSGLFSQTLDGFEGVSPQDFDGQLPLPSELTALFARPASTDGIGKLVTGHRWYFAAIMDASDAARLVIGRDITVQFSGAYHVSIPMLVEGIGTGEDGQCVVLFSSDRNLRDIAPLRTLRAEVIFGETTGFRVPKEAIHLDNYGATFIFLQTGVRAERVNVNILLETGDSYLVESVVERGGPLRPGATIIVRGNNLTHGAIVG